MSFCHLCHPEVMAGGILMQRLLCCPSPAGQFPAWFCFSLSATLHIGPGQMATASYSFLEKGEVGEGRQDSPLTRDPFLHWALHVLLFSTPDFGILNFFSSWLTVESGGGEEESFLATHCPAPACRQPVGQPIGLLLGEKREPGLCAALSCPIAAA